MDFPEKNDEKSSETQIQLPKIVTNQQMSEAREEESIINQDESKPVAVHPTLVQYSGPIQRSEFEIPTNPKVCEDSQLDKNRDLIAAKESELPEELSDTEIETESKRTLRDRKRIKPSSRYDDFVMLSSNVDAFSEPATYKEAMQSSLKEEWVKAMESEIKSLKENKTWILVDLPNNRKPISCKWIFRIKTNAEGSIDKYKARLVARGYTQSKGIDYYETFSPVAKMTTVRLILSIAVNEGLKLTQFDVATAFLNGTLEEEIYMNQPEGYSDGTKKVCKLKRSLYGLKQSPRCWNKCIVDYLKTIGFKQCDTEPCLFIRNRMGNKIILALYVDDGLVASTNQKETEKFMMELKRRFKITTKPATYFLGLEIHNKDKSLKVSQRHYTKMLLERFGMADCKPASTPIIKDAKSDSDEENVIKFPYREAVGALTYLMTGTRPDISYAISVVSRNLENPTKDDVLKVKRIFRYLKGTLHYGIEYKKEVKTGILECYSDSDHGGDVNTGRSTSGILCMYSGGAISWASRRQGCVAISSTEAELVAASEAAREIVWLKRLISEISVLKEIPTLQVDNDAAIKLSQNPEMHKRTKHIALRHFYVRDLVIDNEIKVSYVPTEYQCADILTKPIHKPRLVMISERIGLIE